MVCKSRFFLSGRAEPFYQKIHLCVTSVTRLLLKIALGNIGFKLLLITFTLSPFTICIDRQKHP